MTDNTNEQQPVSLGTNNLANQLPANADEQAPIGSGGLVNAFKADAVVVETKAESLWAKIGQHPVLVVLVLSAATWACVHFVFGF